jgi:hypothetical protein
MNGVTIFGVPVFLFPLVSVSSSGTWFVVYQIFRFFGLFFYQYFQTLLYYNALFCLIAFRFFPKFPKITFFIPIPTPLLFYPFPPLPYLFHSSYFPFFFILYIFLLAPFPPSFSFRHIHFICDRWSLSPRSTFCTFSHLLSPNTCFLSPRFHI